MMAVYFPNMAMPESCLKCPVRTTEAFGGLGCRLSGRICVEGRTCRESFCSAIDVSGHGDLIDAGAMIRELQDEKGGYISGDAAVIGNALESAPVVIPGIAAALPSNYEKIVAMEISELSDLFAKIEFDLCADIYRARQKNQEFTLNKTERIFFWARWLLEEAEPCN